MTAPSNLSPTMAARRAAKADWEARNPADRMHGLVCVADQEVVVEDQNHGVVGTRRVRSYAYKGAIQTDVAVRYDDEPLLWPGASPPPRAEPPRVRGIIRRYHGHRPAGRS